MTLFMNVPLSEHFRANLKLFLTCLGLNKIGSFWKQKKNVNYQDVSTTRQPRLQKYSNFEKKCFMKILILLSP